MKDTKDTLKDIFSNVNEWLKFAEEKNAAIIIFNLSSIFGAAHIITQAKTVIPQLILLYLYWLIVLNTLGLSVALFSFWPKTLSLFDNYYDCKKLEKLDNTLYYGYIKCCEPKSYITRLCNSLQKEGEENSSFESNYAIQIVINSRVAFRKYRYFKAALILTINAILTPIGYILLYFLLAVVDRDLMIFNRW